MVGRFAAAWRNLFPKMIVFRNNSQKNQSLFPEWRVFGNKTFLPALPLPSKTEIYFFRRLLIFSFCRVKSDNRLQKHIKSVYVCRVFLGIVHSSSILRPRFQPREAKGPSVSRKGSPVRALPLRKAPTRREATGLAFPAWPGQEPCLHGVNTYAIFV